MKKLILTTIILFVFVSNAYATRTFYIFCIGLPIGPVYMELQLEESEINCIFFNKFLQLGNTGAMRLNGIVLIGFAVGSGIYTSAYDYFIPCYFLFLGFELFGS